MNQLYRYQALHTLLRSSNRMASDTIAIRWLFAGLMSSAKDYDLFFRLQILEGALGVREGIWWTKGRAGLAEAQRAATSFDLDSNWLEPGNTGMFRLLYNQVANFISRSSIPTTADDILQSTLMGIGLGKDNSVSTKKPAFEVGKLNSKKIQTGKETPKSIAVGVLSRWLEKKAIHMFNKREIDDPNINLRPQPQRNIKKESLNFFNYILFKDMQDPAGKKFRQFLRKTWKGTTEGISMDLWLDAIEKRKSYLKKDIARQMGITPQSFHRQWKKAWNRFTQEYRKNSSLIKFLDYYFSGKGFELPSLLSESELLSNPHLHL